MDFKSLQCFIAVAEQLNFSRAAKNLYISQPSLSIRINALEEELGAKLFNRTHQQVYLTDAGAALLPTARDILEKIHSLRYIVSSVQHNENLPEKLMIGIDITEDRSLPVFDNVFNRFMQRYPDVELKVLDLSMEEYEHKLLSGEMDFCLMVLQDTTPINSMFLSIPLLSEPTVIVTANSDGQALDELLRTREVQLLFEGERGLRWNEQYLDFLKNYVPDVAPTYIENVSLLCMNLFRSKIITFLPKTFAESLKDDRLSVFPITLPRGDIRLTLLWNKMNINPAIQLMVNEFRTEVSAFHGEPQDME